MKYQFTLVMDSLSSLCLFVRNPLLCTYIKKDTCQEVSSYQWSIISFFFLIFSQSELCWRLPHCKPMQPIICSLNDWLIFMSKVNLRFLCMRKCFCITSLKKIIKSQWFEVIYYCCDENCHLIAACQVATC